MLQCSTWCQQKKLVIIKVYRPILDVIKSLFMRCNTRCWRMRLRLKSRRKSNAQCSKMRLEQARHSSTSHCHEYYIGIHILFRTGLVRICQKEVILTYLPEFRYMYSIKKEVSKQFLTKITF